MCFHSKNQPLNVYRGIHVCSLSLFVGHQVDSCRPRMDCDTYLNNHFYRTTRLTSLFLRHPRLTSKRLQATEIFISTEGRVHINYLLPDITHYLQVFKHYNSPFLRSAGTEVYWKPTVVLRVQENCFEFGMSLKIYLGSSE